MDNETKDGMPDFSKAYSPRKAFKLTRSMYFTLLSRIEALEAEKPEAEKPKRKRRTKDEIEAEKANA